MSAGKDAIPLSEENPNWENSGLPDFTCETCGYHGKGYELLCEPDDDTLWCPNCGLASWIWD